MIGDLSEQLNQGLDELQQQQKTSEDKKHAERQNDLTLNLFLWFLASCLALFLWMLDQMSQP